MTRAEGTARAAVEGHGRCRGVRYLVNDPPSKGRPAVVRNHGATLAKGRYLHFLDDDDMLAEGALHAMVSALDARPDAGVAVGWVVPFGDDADWLKDKSELLRVGGEGGRQPRPTARWTVAHILFRGTLYVNSACMVRREHFAPLGGFDASHPRLRGRGLLPARHPRATATCTWTAPSCTTARAGPSLMHDLGKDGTLVMQSNEMIHGKYRKTNGMLEYRALQLR